MKGLFLNQNGSWPLVFCLIMLPFLILAWMANNTQVQTNTAGDFDIQRGLEAAARAAAYQVTPDSQASGDPRIKADTAHTIFRKYIANNLGLDENSMEPLPGSMIKRPDYTLVVYNIDDAYSLSGAPVGKLYRFHSGTLTTISFTPTGNPYLFGINDANITPGVSGTLNCTVDRPAVIVSLSAELDRIMGKDQIIINRWVATKIVKF
ncbi:hypothetical protein [Desulfoscipio gibsoniae]